MKSIEQQHHDEIELNHQNRKLRELLEKWLTLRCWEGFPLSQEDQDVVRLTREILK